MARRLFALFVAAAMVPLALSDWVALSAVTRTAEDLHQKAHTDRTRELSRQVLDRLVAARDVLAVLPGPTDEGVPHASQDLPGLGTTFERLESFDKQGHRRVTGGTTADSPGGPDAPPPAWRSWQALEPTFHTLVIDHASAASPRIVLERHVGGRVTWRGELRAAALWSPIVEGAGDTRWRVIDSAGRALLSLDPPDTLGVDPRQASVALPLDGLFGAGSWQFEHQAPRTTIQFLGSPLATWLGLLAIGTVFIVAFAAHWRIRRVFQPLEALAEGTRRLASGDTRARLEADAAPPDDELGHLARSFNDMADRIDQQFGTLRELAEVDHDILQGAPLGVVAERLLRQALRASPEAVVAISWRDDPSPEDATAEEAVHTLCASQAATTSRATSTRLPDLADLQPGANNGPAGPAPGAWLPGLPGPGWHHVMRAVERKGRVEGLIALALPPASTAPASLDALRDRLAVALTARRREGELTWRATHDSLTGLLNRLGLHEALDRRLVPEAPGDSAVCTAMVLLDLDHFKDINDTRGHDVGDALLRQVAERVTRSVPPGALVARPGGDEFVVLLDGSSAAEAHALASRICDRLREAFIVEGISVLIGASAGIAVSPDHGRTRLELTRRAEIALYTAKARRGSACVFDKAMDELAGERSTRLVDLREAIVRREFVLHYQPRVSAVDGSVLSVEALVRWQHPRLGLLSPGVFIEIAEQAGLMEALGDLVLEEACRQMADWRSTGVPVSRMSVNVSAQQLVSGRLPGRVRDTLLRHGVPASALELEVTESLLAADAAGAQRQLHELRGQGIEIALDDFGTGYSAMAQLRRLPIDVMKIDRSFVADLGKDEGALAITRAIVALAGALRLRIVAEGVETDQQASWLRELGCHELQGFRFARPMPASELVRWLTKQTAGSPPSDIARSVG